MASNPQPGPLRCRGRGLIGALLVAALLVAAVAARPATAAHGVAPASQCEIRAGGVVDSSSEVSFNVHLPADRLRAIVLLVQFPDLPVVDEEADMERAARLLSAAATKFERSSGGRFQLDVEILPEWLELPESAVDYWRHHTSNALLYGVGGRFGLVQDAVDAADAHADLSRYQAVFVFAPTNPSGADLDTTDGLAPFALSPPKYESVVTGLGVRADGALLRHGVVFGRDAADAEGLIVTHETLHLLGLPDLYAYGPASGDSGSRFVGGWDQMGDVRGRAPELLAWQKWKLGWVDDSQVDCLRDPGTTLHTLHPVETADGTQAVVIATQDNHGKATAWVLENRQALGADLQACSTGLLVYKVHPVTRTFIPPRIYGFESGKGPIRVLDANPGQPASGSCADPDAGSRSLQNHLLDDAAFGVGAVLYPKAVYTPSNDRDVADELTLGQYPTEDDAEVKIEVLQKTADDDLIVRVTRFGAPVVTTHPSSQTVVEDLPVSLIATADAAPESTVQWQHSTDGGATFSDIPGATAPKYSFTALASQNGTMFRAVFTNRIGSTASNPALLRVDRRPVAKGDVYVVNQDTTLTVPAPGVLGNDADPDGDALHAFTRSSPVHGTLTFADDGSFSYTPHAGYFGTDSFTYVASDGLAVSGLTTVTITVNGLPVAGADAYTTTEDVALIVSAPGVLDNDSDPDGNPLVVRTWTTPAHGQLTFSKTGSFTYTPDEDYFGTDSFTYRASDGWGETQAVTVSITVTEVLYPTRVDAEEPVVVTPWSAFGARPSFRARLMRIADERPIAGRTISFQVGTKTACTAVTASDGYATCVWTAQSGLLTIANLGYEAVFSGDPDHVASSDHAAVVVARTTALQPVGL